MNFTAVNHLTVSGFKSGSNALPADGIVVPKHVGVKWLYCPTYYKCIKLVL